MQLVIAGNYSQYKEYVSQSEGKLKLAIKQVNNIRWDSGFHYCQSQGDLRGWDKSKIKIVYFGEYWRNPIYFSTELRLLDPNPPLKMIKWGQSSFQTVAYSRIKLGKLVGCSIGQMCEAMKSLVEVDLTPLELKAVMCDSQTKIMSYDIEVKG